MDDEFERNGCRWTRAVRDCRAKLSPTARCVLWALAAHADGRADGMAWPSVTTLRAETGLGRTAIFDAFKELCAPLPGVDGVGCIRRVERNRKTATWQLTGAWPTAATVRHADDLQFATRTEAQDRSPRGRSSVRHADDSTGVAGKIVRHADPPSAERTAQSATRTGIVRHADGHLEGDIEEDKKGQPSGGASPAAPPDGVLPIPDDDTLQRIRLVDAECKGPMAAIAEAHGAQRELQRLGLGWPHIAPAWAALVERWAETGQRPRAALAELKLDASQPPELVVNLIREMPRASQQAEAGLRIA